MINSGDRTTACLDHTDGELCTDPTKFGLRCPVQKWEQGAFGSCERPRLDPPNREGHVWVVELVCRPIDQGQMPTPDTPWVVSPMP